ncbi:unnamed protein product, partial [Rotaria sordida]
MDPDT